MTQSTVDSLIITLQKLSNEGHGGLTVHLSNSQGGMIQLSCTGSHSVHDSASYPEWGEITEMPLGTNYIQLYTEG